MSPRGSAVAFAGGRNLVPQRGVIALLVGSDPLSHLTGAAGAAVRPVVNGTSLAPAPTSSSPRK